jgi:hypothetical protein
MLPALLESASRIKMSIPFTLICVFHSIVFTKVRAAFDRARDTVRAAPQVVARSRVSCRSSTSGTPCLRTAAKEFETERPSSSGWI